MNIQEILSTLQNQVSQNSSALPEGIDSGKLASVASESVLEIFTKQAANGDLSGVTEMFSGSETSADNPVLSGISPDLIKNLTGKLGIDESTAAGISSNILPVIMNVFNNKASSGGLDVQSIIGQFQNGGISNIIQDFMGNDKTAPETGGQKSGILDMIKGFFGK
jgi:Bacterial protein of unknown function (DUF937)